MQQLHFQANNVSDFFKILIQCNHECVVSHCHCRDQQIDCAGGMARFTAILAEPGGSIPKI